MPASFLKIGDELVQDAILHHVEITQELDRHWWCRVECRQTEDKRIPVENLLGQDLQIVTRDQAGAAHVLFDGFILEAGLLYEIYGSFTARLQAVTRSYNLDLTAQEAYYRKQTFASVMQTLASADGLAVDMKCADGPRRNYVQWGEPDFHFLVRMADEQKAWIRPTPQGIQVCDAFQAGARVSWREEDGLLAFDVEGALTPPAFDGTHFDARQMRSVTHSGVAQAPGYFGSSGPMVSATARQSQAQLPAGATFLDGRAATADEYRALLERESVRAAVNRVFGHGFSRKEDLRAGDTVEISGPVDGAGTYGLTRVIHRWTPRGYENEFWCIPATIYMLPEAPRPPGIAGVVTARVVDHDDPRKMGRVQVQYDWQEGGPTGWVRATTPHAGQDRGFHFLPEIGDEVVVAFEHGDPERPYVVGSLWNAVDQAPREEFWGEDVDPNDVKRIVTKSGHRIQLVDKPGKESIVIATPQHLKISLIEKADETGRSMILLHSDGDVFVNAPDGRVHLRANAFSQEVGSGGSAAPSAPPQPPNAPPPSPAASPPPATAATSQAPAVAGPIRALWEKGQQSQREVAGPEVKAGSEKGVLDDKLQPAAELTWAQTSGAARRWGDDSDNLQLGAYTAALSSGVVKEDGGYSANLIKSEVSASLVSAQQEIQALGGAVKQTGSLDVGQVSAYAQVGAEWTDKAKKITAEAGAEADLVHANIGGELNIPVPFTKKVLTIGGGVEGMVGAAAKAGAEAGFTEQTGWSATAEAKAAAGLGLGAWFKLGLKNDRG